MIKIKISGEALTDIAFNERMMPSKCINGIDNNYPLIDVEMEDDNILVFSYDDGKEDITFPNIVRVAS